MKEEKMKKARKAYKLTGSMMSRFLGLGVTQWAIFENGNKVPSVSDMILIELACTPLGMKKILEICKVSVMIKYHREWQRTYEILVKIEYNIDLKKDEININYFNSK